MKWLERMISGGLAALACCWLPAQAGLFTDPDPNWKEAEFALPAPPDDAALREIEFADASRNRVLIDERSVTVGDDEVVRYVLVVRTPGGAQNVTFEGIRCAVGGWRMYASGRTDGGWSIARDAGWQPIVNTSYNRARAALAKDYFCDGGVPPRDRNEVLQRLRDGHELPK